MDLHHESALLSNIHHMSDMSQISVGNLNHYTVVYDLYCKELKDRVKEQWSAHWRSMEDCFRDIYTFGVGYNRTKGYCRADYNAPEASAINYAKSTKNPEPCFRCSGPHFQTKMHKTQKST